MNASLRAADVDKSKYSVKNFFMKMRQANLGQGGNSGDVGSKGVEETVMIDVESGAETKTESGTGKVDDEDVEMKDVESKIDSNTNGAQNDTTSSSSNKSPTKPTTATNTTTIPGPQEDGQMDIEFEFSDDESGALNYFKSKDNKITKPLELEPLQVTQAVVDLLQKPRKKPLTHEETLEIETNVRQNILPSYPNTSNSSSASNNFDNSSSASNTNTLTTPTTSSKTNTSAAKTTNPAKMALPRFEKSKLQQSRNEMLTAVKLNWKKKVTEMQAERTREVLEIAQKLKRITERGGSNHKHKDLLLSAANGSGVGSSSNGGSGGKSGRSREEEAEYQRLIKELEHKELEKKAKQMAILELKKRREMELGGKSSHEEDYENEIDLMEDYDEDYNEEENDDDEEVDDDDDDEDDNDEDEEDEGDNERTVDVMETDSQRARVEQEHGIVRQGQNPGFDFELDDDDYQLTQLSQFPAPPPMSPPNLKDDDVLDNDNSEEEQENEQDEGEENSKGVEGDKSNNGVYVSTQFRKRQALRKLMNEEEEDDVDMTQPETQAQTQMDTQENTQPNTQINSGPTQAICSSSETQSITRNVDQTQAIDRTFETQRIAVVESQTQVIQNSSKTQTIVSFKKTRKITVTNEDDEDESVNDNEEEGLNNEEENQDPENNETANKVIDPTQHVKPKTYRRRNKLAKTLIDGEAEESEDDWMGLGDGLKGDKNSDDDGDDDNEEENEQQRKELEELRKILINDEDSATSDAHKNENKNRELFMQREMELDEEDIRRAQEIVLGLKKKNGAYDDSDDDEDGMGRGWDDPLMDEETRRILYIQREKKRQERIQMDLEKGKSGWLFNNPKAQAFVREMFDHQNDEKKQRELAAIFGDKVVEKKEEDGEGEDDDEGNGNNDDDEDEDERKEEEEEEKAKAKQEKLINMFKEDVRSQLSFLNVDSDEPSGRNNNNFQDDMGDQYEFENVRDNDKDTQEFEPIPSSFRQSSVGLSSSVSRMPTIVDSRTPSFGSMNSNNNNKSNNGDEDDDDDDDMAEFGIRRKFKSSIVSSFRESMVKDRKAKELQSQGREEVNVVVAMPYTDKKYNSRSAFASTGNSIDDRKSSSRSGFANRQKSSASEFGGFGREGGNNKKRNTRVLSKHMTEDEEKVEQMVKERLKRPKVYDHSSSFKG